MKLLLSITAAFIVTMTLMPIIIKLFKSINLLDIPDKRKIHQESTPSLGGIAIFVGVIFALLLSTSFADLASQKFFIGGTLLIFLLGVRDDLSSLMARHKLVVQIFAAVLVVYFGEVNLSGLHGLFGLNSFPWGLNEIFTIFVIVVLTNSFNLIDGIDGLAGSIGLFITLFFGWHFLTIGDPVSAGISLAVSGSLLAFLLYNWYPSKVFMGDTGSMMIGFIISTLMVKFLQIPESTFAELGFGSPVSLCVALLILPIYDTLRVFTVRFYNGKHPLSPDRNHVHHLLLKLRANHAQATILLISYNIVIVAAVVFLQHLGDLILILSIVVLTVSIGATLGLKVMRREAARIAPLVSRDVKLSKSA